ncbi:hypothetical protein [Noviherbaspirillum aridicola]|uniref:SmpA/OmlA family protein n=1 Tax=Noviherbaspirillum aridicola TaxID=2849687 RepID=A0ABQ4Q0I0_9BURK|nr:hypothetical protein [Noviherbaspirillum aridicola]GIZ50654.1 hypothetical protein NCCP691_06680 [Noviherbaspirillum aridicola]
MRLRPVLPAALLALLPVAVFAQAMPEGYLCCNMRTDGSWISDINYQESGKRVIPAGTPAKVTGYGRYRVHVSLDGSKQAIGNDYSRDLDLESFARRYVVAEDPRLKLGSYSPKVREAIKSARLLPGMTREQVLMSVGYPVSSENADLNAKVWRFWLSSFAEFQVVFDGKDRVKEVVTDAQTRNLIMADD